MKTIEIKKSYVEILNRNDEIFKEAVKVLKVKKPFTLEKICKQLKKSNSEASKQLLDELKQNGKVVAKMVKEYSKAKGWK